MRIIHMYLVSLGMATMGIGATLADCPTSDFDGFSPGTIITDQYPGVAFSLLASDHPTCVPDGPGDCGPNVNYFARIHTFDATCSGDQGLMVDFSASSCEFCPLWLKMVFDAPAREVSFCMGNGQWSGGLYRIRVYSTVSGGDPIEIQTAANPIEDGGTVLIPITVSRPTYEIRRIELDFGGTSKPDADSSFWRGSIDDLMFDVAPIAITTQPDEEACAGDFVTLSITVIQPSVVSFQWRKDSVPIPGATSNTLMIGPVTAGDAGTYDLEITSLCETVISDSAELTINGEPSISTQPMDQSVCDGDLAAFTVSANGGALQYQWRKNGGDLPGEDGTSLIISSVTPSDAGEYDVVVTNSCGTATSSTAELTVGKEPQVMELPSDADVCVGDPATFSVSATGTPAPIFQWRRNGAALSDGPAVGGGVITGSSTNTLAIDPIALADEGFYDAVITNECGSVTPPPGAVLNVSNGPQITDDPDSIAVAAGAPATFTVIATGVGSLTYQWRRDGLGLSDGGAIAGSDTDTLTITAVGCGDAGLYDVVVTDDCGSDTSAGASLTTEPSECPLASPLPCVDCVIDTYLLTGAPTGTPWSWRIASDDGAFFDTPVIDVAGVAPGGTTLDVATAFADSINAYTATHGCTDNSLKTFVEEDVFGVRLAIRSGCDAEFTLFVGAAGGPAGCMVGAFLPACGFNPSIEQMALPGHDCNGNGRDDFLDILLEFSPDDDQNGVPDECEPCNADCVQDTDMSGRVRVPDLIKLLGCWGSIVPGGDPVCACLDVAGGPDEGPDGRVRVPDLIVLLGKWGVCP